MDEATLSSEGTDAPTLDFVFLFFFCFGCGCEKCTLSVVCDSSINSSICYFHFERVFSAKKFIKIDCETVREINR